MAYDLQHYLQMDLPRVLYRKRFSPRYLIGLIEQLPDAGALAASLQGGAEFRGWGRDRHMAADVIDILVAANSQKKAKPYPRPTPKKQAQGRSLRSMFPGRR